MDNLLSVDFILTNGGVLAANQRFICEVRVVRRVRVDCSSGSFSRSLPRRFRRALFLTIFQIDNTDDSIITQTTRDFRVGRLIPIYMMSF